MPIYNLLAFAQSRRRYLEINNRYCIKFYNMQNEKELLKMFLTLLEKTKTIEEQLRKISLNERNPLGDTYLDTDEVCDLLKVCKRTLQKHRDEASISYIQFGGKTLYKLSDIQEALEKNYQAAINR
ncbi:helix-turn-helix domain-containing protein [Labilibaculum sp.]|uniref:helix-turn-helix domain-containing protein n=1 Tax=Labilibaculum sp. TaxID=2060723 RepID=UPI0035616857